MADERFDEVNDLIDEAMAEVGAERPSPDFVARLRQEAERAPRRTPGAWRAQAIAAAAAIVLTVFGARVFDRSASFVNPVAVPQRDVALAAEPGGAGAPAALPWTRPSYGRGRSRPKRVTVSTEPKQVVSSS